MDATIQQQTVFHLTGKRPDGPLEAIDQRGLRPALMARYRDLSRLRYDFPVVLIDSRPGEPFVRSLTDIVNQLVRETAPAGPAGEALRKQLLHIERDIRQATAAGARGRLSELWDTAVTRLAARIDPELAEVLQHAGGSIAVDGEVLDCDEAMPEALFTHAWRVLQREKARRARAGIDELIVGLNDILRADFVRSAAGRQPERLKASIGDRQQGLFDFNAMAGLLSHGAPADTLPTARRQRIEQTLSALRAQRFFPAANAPAVSAGDEPYRFDFDTCRGVQQAFRERMPEMAELVKAMSIAELECDSRYDEARHDAFFERFDEQSLSSKDMQVFPDYCVCLRNRPTAAAADANLLSLLSSGISVKVLVETDDILQESAIGQGDFAFGVRNVQLASLAIGLTETFVLQSVSSNLLQLRDRLHKGLSVPSAALFSIYTPAATTSDLPRYLVSAAAMQSRAFPAFTYDPSAGVDLASRFSLEDNPQATEDWPLADFEYADTRLQRVTGKLAFTLADFVATDSRYTNHFAQVPYSDSNEHLLVLDKWLCRPPDKLEGSVPCLLAVDRKDFLQHLIVDDSLVRSARRCLENWHRLQELGGIHNSHAERLLARERALWEEEKRAEIAALSGAGVKPEVTVTAETATAPAAAGIEEPDLEPEHSPDEAWIETIRCSSCNECTQINDKMFAYNENKQAYLKDVRAGTYRQLVEAAESCQLSIIHPGKPVDPGEPGLAELIERAAPFQ